jgi:8-oxo-dGTP pyrophosphatase MutT (NUDIX family)
MKYRITWTNFIEEIEKKRKTAAFVVCVNENNKILIIKRSPDEASKQGYWDLPGGQVDDEDNSIEAGALRELQEETGLKAPLTNLKYVDKLESEDADKYYYTTTGWSGTIKFARNPKTGNIEHTEAKWKTIDEIKEDKSLELRTFPVYLLDEAIKKLKNE